MLVFDAPNVPTTKLFDLAVAAKDHGQSLRLVVPVTAHAEKLMDLRQAKGRSYDAEIVRQALADVGVEILPLDAPAAESIAKRLCARFPTRDAWQDAKWMKLHNAPRGADKRAPATIDWYTAALCPPDAIVVTDDTGAEFHGCTVIKSEALAGVLRELSSS